MNFHEQPTILFVPLECRYVTAASAAALLLQPDAGVAELRQTMRASDREEERIRKDRGKQQAIKLGLKGQALIMEAKKGGMAGCADLHNS